MGKTDLECAELLLAKDKWQQQAAEAVLLGGSNLRAASAPLQITILEPSQERVLVLGI